MKPFWTKLKKARLLGREGITRGFALQGYLQDKSGGGGMDAD